MLIKTFECFSKLFNVYQSFSMLAKAFECFSKLFNVYQSFSLFTKTFECFPKLFDLQQSFLFLHQSFNPEEFSTIEGKSQQKHLLKHQQEQKKWKTCRSAAKKKDFPTFPFDFPHLQTPFSDAFCHCQLLIFLLWLFYCIIHDDDGKKNCSIPFSISNPLPKLFSHEFFLLQLFFPLPQFVGNVIGKHVCEMLTCK